MSEAVAKIEPGEVSQIDQPTGDPVISMIERAARDPNVDMDKFERLMAMKERADKAIALRSFNEAVALAKSEFGKILKNRAVDFTTAKGRTNYKHEDLAGIASVIDPVLGKHGLSYRYRSVQQGQQLTVTCILSHRDGHSEETALGKEEDHSGNKNSIQAVGSAATYLQRYTLKLALGLASSHDDDGRKAGEQTGLITPEQIIEIEALIVAAGADREWIMNHHGIGEFADMTAKDFQKAKAGLTARIRKMKEVAP